MEIGLPRRASLSKLKNWLVVPPFITHDCWSFNKIYIHRIQFLRNPNFLKTGLRKSWSRKSKAFWISILTRNISIISDINLPLSPVNLLFYINCLLWWRRQNSFWFVWNSFRWDFWVKIYKILKILVWKARLVLYIYSFFFQPRKFCKILLLTHHYQEFCWFS